MHWGVVRIGHQCGVLHEQRPLLGLGLLLCLGSGLGLLLGLLLDLLLDLDLGLGWCPR